jgi:hypothetical protein
MLEYANTLWAQGYFYTAVIVYLPVQIGIVLLHNITLYFVVIMGAQVRG